MKDHQEVKLFTFVFPDVPSLQSETCKQTDRNCKESGKALSYTVGATFRVAAMNRKDRTERRGEAPRGLHVSLRLTPGEKKWNRLGTRLLGLGVSLRFPPLVSWLWD